MTSISIVFELSQEVLDGLASGKYERVGGVVRTTDGKKVVTWLTEIGEAAPDTDGLPSILSGSNMIMGMQVANMAVSAAGTALIYRKLLQIEQQIQGLSGQLGQVSKDLDWLDHKHLLQHLAPVSSALNEIRGIPLLKDQALAHDKLTLADNALGPEANYFRGLMGDMLAQKLEQQRPGEFAACYKAWIQASQGRVQTMAALNEMDVAHNRIESFKQEHADLGKQLIAAAKDTLRPMSAGLDSLQQSPLLQQVLQQCSGAHEIIKGQVLQLGFMKDNKLSLSDLIQPENAKQALAWFKVN